MLRLLTAGESHGPALVAVIEGLPAGLSLSPETLNRDLARRQGGYGRGGRMQIERDQVRLEAGVRHGVTTGSPVALRIENRDYTNWQAAMHPEPLAEDEQPPDIAVYAPRPGHTDLAGAQKLLTHDVRSVLERASARNTAMRVATGSIAKALLAGERISVLGHVLGIGEIEAQPDTTDLPALAAACEQSPVSCADRAATASMIALIDRAREAGDSLGGRVEVIATGVPPGLGHFSEWDRRLDGRLAQQLMSVPAVKAVEIGDGFASGTRRGSEVHDPITYDAAKRRYVRPSNHAGGIEGGLSNGERIIVRAVMKPIPTLGQPLASVDLRDREATLAARVRSDVCAVPACAVVCEAVVAWELACAFLERFGGDTVDEVHASYHRYLSALETF